MEAKWEREKIREGSIYKLTYGFSFPFIEINLQKIPLKLGKLGINQLYFYVPAHNNLKIKATFMEMFSSESVLNLTYDINICTLQS